MMKANNRISSIALAATLCFGALTLQAQAQSPSKGYDKERLVATDVKIQLTNLLAQTRRQGPPLFSLMRENPAAKVGEPMFSVGRMAAGSSLIVQGSGILGRLTKWTGFTQFAPRDIAAAVYISIEKARDDKAIAWLERGYEQRHVRMTFLKVEPKWNNLRNDPRFENLMHSTSFTP